MTTKKLALVLLAYIITISGVLGVLREVFLKEYEASYHFWLSVFSGVIIGVSSISLIWILGKKGTEKNKGDSDS